MGDRSNRIVREKLSKLEKMEEKAARLREEVNEKRTELDDYCDRAELSTINITKGGDVKDLIVLLRERTQWRGRVVIQVENPSKRAKVAAEVHQIVDGHNNGEELVEVID